MPVASCDTNTEDMMASCHASGNGNCVTRPNSHIAPCFDCLDERNVLGFFFDNADGIM